MTSISLPLPGHASIADRATNESARDPRYHGIWSPGIRLFGQLRFRTKAALIAIVLTVPLMLQLCWQLNEMYKIQQRTRANATRQHVEVAHGVLVWAHAQETAGRMTREQAQMLARAQIGAMRYDGSEYFWINDMRPYMVMHPFKPELDGTDLSQFKDPNGFALFSAMADAVRKQGDGFVSYQWPKPGHNEPVDKVSYVKGFAPWGWMVGSGVYTGDLRDEMLKSFALTSAFFAPTFLAALYLFICFNRVVVGGLVEARRHLAAMTEGDLTTAPAPRGHDEVTEMMGALQTMQLSLRGMVRKVRDGSDGIEKASDGVACGAKELSARTEQSAANLEQTAASMEEIGSTVKNTSDHTAEAAQVARRNSEVAADGGKAMHHAVTKMEEIHAGSMRMVGIIGTIESIAFQTNLLALNAAVEAARAGVQGRGFAVVAAEVRVLAKRSADAAKEIKTLIDSSEQQITQGTDVVRKAGETMAEIVSASQRVDHLLSEIAVGAREQALGVGQIGEAIQELDRVTQQNAALVQDTASSSSAMRDQAMNLAREVARFKLPA